MTTTLTVPKSNIPIGTVVIGGATFEVPQHPEFVRFFSDLARRTGGVTAPTNTELSSGVADVASSVATLDNEDAAPRSNPEAREALRAVDELRNELASLRGDNDGLRRRIEQLEDKTP